MFCFYLLKVTMATKIFKKISAGEMSNIFVYNNLKVTAKMLKMLKLMQYGCNT